MLIVIPLLDTVSFVDTPNFVAMNLDLVERADASQRTAKCEYFFKDFVRPALGTEMKNQWLVYMSVKGSSSPEDPCYKNLFNSTSPETITSDLPGSNKYADELADLRLDEMYIVRSTSGDSKAIFDNRLQHHDDGLYGLITTIFVVILLGAGAAFFMKDVNEMVIAPIEDMTQFVKKLAKDPFASISTQEDGDNADETGMIKTALNKVTRLLRVGFGEAGAEIIAGNMEAGDSFSAVVEGQKVYGIFGFCDIRRFTDTTEALEEKVMSFVNTIGEVVHNAVVAHHGAPNKNIGDAFLLVWKMKLESAYKKKTRALRSGSEQGSLSPGIVPPTNSGQTKDEQERMNLEKEHATTHALVSFLECIQGLDSNDYLKDEIYTDPRLIKHMGADYSVKMGYGLHYGWAIEGAIGSEHKVDASYLSPNVNMAARLEAATKQYGVPILMSDAFYDLLSPSMKGRCRKLDRVTVKGSVKPIELFGYDIEHPRPTPGSPEEEAARWQHALANMFEPPTQAQADYRNAFHEALDMYIAGDWGKAKTMFEGCLATFGDDYPAESLYNYMKNYGFEAPSDWVGVHELTEK